MHSSHILVIGHSFLQLSSKGGMQGRAFEHLVSTSYEVHKCSSQPWISLESFKNVCRIHYQTLLSTLLLNWLKISRYILQIIYVDYLIVVLQNCLDKSYVCILCVSHLTLLEGYLKNFLQTVYWNNSLKNWIFGLIPPTRLDLLVQSSVRSFSFAPDTRRTQVLTRNCTQPHIHTQLHKRHEQMQCSDTLKSHPVDRNLA